MVHEVSSALEWEVNAGIAAGLADFDRFDQSSAVARRLVFVPKLSDLDAPYWDASAAPLIFGMTPDMTRRDLGQALLEEIAF